MVCRRAAWIFDFSFCVFYGHKTTHLEQHEDVTHINGFVEGNRWVEQQGKAFLWSQNRAEAKNRCLGSFPQTFILVEQIRKTIHRSEDLPLTDVVQRLRSFFSQHEQDLHEISFQKGILSLHSFKLAAWKKTLQATYCLQKFIVLP